MGVLALLVACDGSAFTSGAGFPTAHVSVATPLDGPRVPRLESEGYDVRFWRHMQMEAAVADDLEAWKTWSVDAPDDFIELTAVSVHPENCDKAAALPASEGVHRALAFCGDPRHADAMENAAARHAINWAVQVANDGHAVPTWIWDRLEAHVASDGVLDMAHVQNFLDTYCAIDRPADASRLRALRTAFGAQGAQFDRTCRQSDPQLAEHRRRTCATGDCWDEPDPLHDLDATLSAGDAWIPRLLRLYPAHRGAILDATERCAKDAYAPSGVHCLEVLADADWPRAQAVASQLPDSSTALAEVRASLAQFDSADALRAHLVSLGFEDRPVTSTDPMPEARPMAVLRNRNLLLSRVLWNSISTHTWNAAQMLRAGGLEPSIDDISAPVDWGRRTGRIHLEDRRYQQMTPALASTDLYTAAAFANAIFEAEDHDARAALPSNWSGAIVVGPEAGLRSLHDDGLLVLDPE